MSNKRSVSTVGVIGCGNIAHTYFGTNERFDFLEIVACADLDIERAESKAAEFNIARACSVEDLLADPEISTVINLTVPAAHGPVMLNALRAGKNVYNEKPFTVTRQEAREAIGLAGEKGLRVGSAPDTFLGGGIQTCRKLIDDGWIGTPVAATAFMVGRGAETWHPNPAFFYQPGGGPMFDMGPYYLTALINLLGPVRRVTGSACINLPERLVTSEPFRGQKIVVETPTHVAGILDFHCGAIGTLVTTFDIQSGDLPVMEIYGTHGTLSVPDPNTFGGPVRLRRNGGTEWKEIPLSHGYMEQCRGIGAADMIYSLRSGRRHRAHHELAYHVLDLMHAFHDSSSDGRHVDVRSSCERPAAFPLGLRDGVFDD